ncbi:MAG: tRNA 4-thiouridine(8) synthase ThiI, partial [Clostridia bacterium]|nr:tRNA 4-thiouridine(8) synthase ThiI [Clostridia bacterium]
MTRCVLLKYGELILKGLNKRYFEERLLCAVREQLAPLGEFEITALQSTVTLVPSDDSLVEPALERMKRVFGIVSVCVAWMVPKDPEAIKDAVRDVVAPTLSRYSSFKCEAKRSDKRFGMTSPEIAAMCGAICAEKNPGIKVDVHDPEVTVTVEIRDRFAFIHAGSER